MNVSGHGLFVPVRAVFCALSVAMLTAGCGGGDANPPEAANLPEAAIAAEHPAVVILEPADGAELASGPVHVRLGADHVAIVPAGDMTPNSGHHHLLLNVAVPADGEAIPVEEAGFVHLGQAQTEYTFADLPPGEYTLVAVIGDYVHRVFPQVMDTVRFAVLAP